MTTPDSGPPAPDALPAVRPDARDDEYSATVLASHWVQRPDPGSVPTVVADPAAAPDDATVLRFGPGVTAALARRPYPTPPTLVTPPAPRRRPQRHALPVLVLVAAVLFLFWREHTASVTGVREVSVTAARETLGCDTTAGIVGVVRTDGRPGTLSYRWVRSDGTSSDVRHTTVARGQRQVRLELLWSFEGPGRHAAVAELRVLTPERRSAEIRFVYDCP
ncbi:hypothetical protein NFX46_15965 [Streptomyces phaeoluteigriseus]|uniref:Ig-like domain-containing protein n=1 Tax=Streptomyces phaeoluteigriseus TaxID=114686 RepID=A0ABY4Z7X1_9ACTN|nr:hypothetical protein [Streptomyces phaeoluteigriseus]USQ85153.1 hypothetical protein NFX46_15965 [Streptomyces phaeoluteigriseus]